ncbi:MAG: hypothetical protein EPN93_00340 [Spirochaetes bacterium]|nr:MAG: hypothetical protein EPN93_00340 [Spirochaetota bacterium]
MKAKRIIYPVIAAAAIVLIVYFTIPVNRVNIHSQLIMLGDLNGDNRWDEMDRSLLVDFIEDPFSFDSLTALKTDANRNGFTDEEDIALLNHLYGSGDPYEACTNFPRTSGIFPRPRELFRYIPTTEYIQRPLYLLKNTVSASSPLAYVSGYDFAGGSGYLGQLRAEIYSESLRFTFAYRKRRGILSRSESEDFGIKIDRCNHLYRSGDYYTLLLNLIGIVEDAETMSVENQPAFVNNLLVFRNHLRELLESPVYEKFNRGEVKYETVFAEMERHLSRDLDITISLGGQKAPREFTNPENYSERAEWQFWKSTADRKEIMQLLLYAQYDGRYLRSSAKTSVKNEDIGLQNHNLPMILLFREAMRINNGNKKAAVGMIDEAVRIPFSWIKIIPREKLPRSIALENFLLPGNKEDGSDKSRHWNVFGGISLYKSPEESLVLGLRREMADLRRDEYTPEAMTEFIRDTIANLNGIYHVVVLDASLVYK